uniref:Ovule protein n=1 Tax=Strongyloides venezuelensis TaxID=75913 RepID=A0A0K0EU11_STRVS
MIVDGLIEILWNTCYSHEKYWFTFVVVSFCVFMIQCHIHRKRISNLQRIYKFFLLQIMDGPKSFLLEDHILMIIQ